ncbi:copper resistance protein CopB [Oceanisphaera profunda]|uniref:Copper resistance protein CopB n=1 Tax=Oceanisphaera profunda TaxID=1416627 RepID=A0A1Y0D802_9GAMM|nr:copper resistance protein B [Oceanisphaera profunda]ART83185.1 copper resistance protein CopB [Oceanisphaera profunda]
MKSGLNSILLALTVLPAGAALAQDAHAGHGSASANSQMKDMDHRQMKDMDHSQMKDMDHSQMKDMDHSQMKDMDHSQMKDMDHSQMKDMDHSQMQGMDHGSMQMQGGSAPADARDPDAYSGGFTLEDGPYALPGPRQLRLADEHTFYGVLVDKLERVDNGAGHALAFDTRAWIGRDYNRAVLKAEGDIEQGKLAEASTELLWSHALSTFWNSELGVRYDTGHGPDQGWLALGVAGLAPYWFELDATTYLGDNGQTALAVEAEYELLLTQRLVLQPSVELTAYGKDDAERGQGQGLSELVAGARLRYEIDRQFAPYLGWEWATALGNSADLRRIEDEATQETRWLAGVKFWF